MVLRCSLFAGNAVLDQVAAGNGVVNRHNNNVPEVVRPIQEALLMRDPSCLPRFGADGDYGSETTEAVRQLQLVEFPDINPNELQGLVAHRTIVFLDDFVFARENAPPPPPPPLFVRQHAWALEPTDTWHPIMEAFARAVGVMQSRPASDPTSWAFQAALHGTYMQPLSAAWNDCQHGNWFFLPWHRLYLYYFERIVRAAVQSFGGPADFALPYWNYEAPAPADAIPFAFRRPFLSDNATTNPLFLDVPFRRAGVSNGTARINQQLVNSANTMAMTLFVNPPVIGFGGGDMRRNHVGPQGTFGGVESRPHNPVHGAIGGQFVPQCGGALMTDPNCAALDPIFWLHHANIDRLWNVWLASGGSRANPSNGNWLNESFVFFDETGAQVTKTSAEVVDSAAQLGYVYDDQPQQVQINMSEMREAEPPEMAGASEQVLAVTSEAGSVTVALPEVTRSLVERVFTGAANIYLVIEDIRAEVNTGIAYAVYLNLADPNDLQERERQLVGVISLFGIELLNQQGAGVPGLRHTFDVTGIARDLAALGRWDPSGVTVTIEPVDPLVGDDEAVQRSALFASLPPVQFGRVSLFVG